MVHSFDMKGLLLLFCLSSGLALGQRSYLDSLLGTIKKPVQSDTMRAFQYNELAWTYLDFHLDSARHWADKGLNYSKKIGYVNGEMDAKNTLGIVYRSQSRYQDAINLYEQLIDQRKKHGQEDKLVGTYSNLGSAYYEQGKFGKALSYYQKAFEIAKKYRQDENELVLANNIAVAYKNLGLYEEAIHWFEAGLKENKRIKDEAQDGVIYANLATVYHEQKLHKESVRFSLIAKSKLEALDLVVRAPSLYYNLVIDYRMLKRYDLAKGVLEDYHKFAEKLDEAEIWSDYYSSLANYYNDLGRQKEAELAVNQSIEFIDSLNDPLNYGIVLNVKARILADQKKFDQALQATHMAEHFILQSEDSSSLINTYTVYYEIYKELGDYEKALYFSEKANELSSRLDIARISDQISTLNALNELEQKEQELKIAAENTRRIEAESGRKSTFINGLIVIAILIILLLVIAYRSIVQRKRTNLELQQKNEVIGVQKALVEEKQNEMLASIQYAKRIQDTLLAQSTLIRRFLPESFIYFNPKDIVSGDFYWGAALGDKFYLAVCDSTGHGVPGALMSTLNSSFLNEAVNQLKISEPGAIFNHVRQRLIESIAHEGAQDGMDGILFCFDFSEHSVSYAAAYNSPVIVRKGEVIRCAADRMPVGLSDKMTPFQTFPLNLESGDALYATTDGVLDQFGGAHQKKLKWNGFSDFILQLSEYPMTGQDVRFEQFYDNWKGSNDQIDDVCVFGTLWR